MMSYNIISPSITATHDGGKINQIQSYLYQLAEQLNWVLNTLSDKNATKDITTEVVETKEKHITSYANKDFNELIHKTGYYWDYTSPETAHCSNYPVNTVGLLEVISVGRYAYQTYRTIDGVVYMRSYCAIEGWTAWKQLTLLSI